MASTRRNRSHHSKAKHHRSGQILHAHGPNQANTDQSWPTLPPLSAPDGNKENLDLIQGWLDDVQVQRPGTRTSDVNDPYHAKNSDTRHHSRLQSHPVQSSPELSWAPHELPPVADRGTTALHTRHGRRVQEHERDWIAREDSSLIALDYDRRPTLDAEVGYYGRGKKRRRSGSDDSLPSRAPSLADYQFEKRPRYKTRSDRYEVAKHDKSRPKKRRENKMRDEESNRVKKRKMNPVASAKEVMDSFNSNSILTERMTVGSSHLLPHRAGLTGCQRCSHI